jgi:hypothetical protein
MKNNNWNISDWEEDYIVFVKQDSRTGNYNKFALVGKIEEGKWIVFLDGGDAGHKILKYPRNRIETIRFMRSYVRTH